MSTRFAKLLQKYFTTRLADERAASPNTVESYSDAFRLLLGFLEAKRDRAPEQVELEARSMGFTPDISPRVAEQQVSYIDVALPPGTGAGSMIERYGEDRVLLRDAATCP